MLGKHTRNQITTLSRWCTFSNLLYNLWFWCEGVYIVLCICFFLRDITASFYKEGRFEHIPLALLFFKDCYWSACARQGKWAVMYLCVRGQRSCIYVLCVSLIFASFYDFDIWFWNYSANVIFFYFSFYGRHIIRYALYISHNEHNSVNDKYLIA